MNATDLDQLDQILSSDDVLTPSSGFAAGVMEAVREAAGEPPPLPFPWGRFTAGLLGCGIFSGSAIALTQRIDWSILSQPAAQLGAVAPELGYATAVLGLTLGFLRVQRTLARSSP
jgi:hypothetical protein